jgi:hypothetical protein
MRPLGPDRNCTAAQQATPNRYRSRYSFQTNGQNGELFMVVSRLPEE